MNVYLQNLISPPQQAEPWRTTMPDDRLLNLMKLQGYTLTQDCGCNDPNCDGYCEEESDDEDEDEDMTPPNEPKPLVENTDMDYDVEDTEMPAAPPLEVILPTNPYFYNYFLQYALNAASESAPVKSQQPRARPVLAEDLPSISELTQTQPPTAPYPTYNITPACIPPESWLEEALHISHLPRGSIAAPTTRTKRPPHPHFARSTLFGPRIRRSKRKDGDIRDRDSYSTSGPRLTPREVPPQLSAQEEDNIRKLELEAYLESRHSRRKPRSHSTEGSPFGCSTPSASSSASSSYSSSRHSSASSSSSASSPAADVFESGSQYRYAESESAVREEEEEVDNDDDDDDAGSATSEYSDRSESAHSSASWASGSSYASSASYGSSLSAPPRRADRLMRMHEHQRERRRRQSQPGLWQRLRGAIPDLWSAV